MSRLINENTDIIDRIIHKKNFRSHTVPLFHLSRLPVGKEVFIFVKNVHFEEYTKANSLYLSLSTHSY